MSVTQLASPVIVAVIAATITATITASIWLTPMGPPPPFDSRVVSTLLWLTTLMRQKSRVQRAPRREGDERAAAQRRGDDLLAEVHLAIVFQSDPRGASAPQPEGRGATHTGAASGGTSGAASGAAAGGGDDGIGAGAPHDDRAGHAGEYGTAFGAGGE